MLNHSATHILHAVLRRELGQHVRQAGSLVTPERLRFDFNHSGAIADEQLAPIEARLISIFAKMPAFPSQELSYDEAIRQGALAFFGDKYGDRVRVVQIGDFSTELCGGTHVRASGEIGLFKLQSEGGVAAGVRRVEAFTGEGALDLIHNYEQRLKEIGNLVRGSADDAVDKVKKLLERQKELEREIEKLRGEFEKDQIPELLREAKFRRWNKVFDQPGRRRRRQTTAGYRRPAQRKTWLRSRCTRKRRRSKRKSGRFGQQGFDPALSCRQHH